MAGKEYLWIDGRTVESGRASVHILTHSLQYGSGIFEGMRAYKTANGTAIFRLNDHIKRFVNSARIRCMDLGYTESELREATLGIVRRNGLSEGYIRPFAFYNDTKIGLSTIGKEVSVAIAAVPFGNYFKSKEKGISCKVSSWRRINSEILPPQAKASGNYANSILASDEAKRNGADEAILLSADGYVAEGPGENIFLVEEGELVTPSREADILLGITRDSLMKIAESMGIVVNERQVHREELYTCDEVFFSGTAAELTPIVSIDSRPVGKGREGPITRMLSDKFSEIVQGKEREYAQWLTIV